jgi:hypothetical protein
VQLFAYNQIGPPDELVIWVGVMDAVAVPDVTFEMEDRPHPPRPIKPRTIKPSTIAIFETLGDEVCDSHGKPLNHRAIFIFDWPATTARFFIHVHCGNETFTLTSRRLPVQIPTQAEGGFNLLLSSCYYEPNDRKRPLSKRIASLKPQADLTLLAGDQVYLDLPSQQNLPTPKHLLAQTLGKKYQANWFARNPNHPGLSTILAHGPVVCLPDDHEFWNNFPYSQAQLNNTHSEQNRNIWSECATTLFNRYQQAPVQEPGFLRLDLAPLSFLFLDTRSSRDNKSKRIFTDASKAALNQWKKDLLQNKTNGKPAIGLLCSGQALMIDAAGWPEKYYADMEMPNYMDFDILKNNLEELLFNGVPIIYITGDVHWGRIIEGRNPQGKPLFYEIIASPSRLIDTVGTDQWRDLKSNIGAIFGARRDFPRHSDAPEKLPGMKLAGLKFAIEHRQCGDHVAMLRFQRTASGVDLYVDYHCTDTNDALQLQHSSTRGPFHISSL